MDSVVVIIEETDKEVLTFADEKWKLVQDYMAVRRHQFLVNYIGNGANFQESVENCASMSNNEEEKENDETRNSTHRRGERTASKLAGLKIKKNLNLPLKLRRPSSSDIFEGSLQDKENYNGEIRTTRTRVVKKCSRSEVMHLPLVVSNEISKDSNSEVKVQKCCNPETNVTISVNSSVKSTNSDRPAANNLVKMRMEQFENLIVKPESEKGKEPNELCDKVVDKHEKNNKVAQSLNAASELQTTDQLNSNYLTVPEVDGITTDAASTTTTVVMKASRITRAMTQSNKRKVNASESSSSENDLPNSKSTPKAIKTKEDKINTVKTLRSNTEAGNKATEKPKAAEVARKKEVFQEKLKKVKANREADQLKKQANNRAVQEKKAEKMKAVAAEKERQQKEEAAAKKAAAKQKKLEQEARRMREEAARLARLEEKEEEHKRAEAAYKKKQEEENEAIRQKRLAQESKMLENKQLKPKEKTENAKTLNSTYTAAGNNETYVMTPENPKRILKNPKTEEDYGVDHAETSDSSEDEDHPKKRIPAWAMRHNRETAVTIDAYIPLQAWQLYKCDVSPKLKLLGLNKLKRPRTSSAIWNTPPSLK
ncbi:uncharacterized protein LOC142325604 [Lycorma delicatula]|uniref:uncharacterized protein LOC142325604 n=1 Tax=Lycorma delicatula TaxID=130591 RepID=UPI003F51A479